MTVEFDLGDLKFEWDDVKAEKNWKKHKVRFETAVEVFLDEYAYDEYDELHSDDEDRIKIVGKVENILTVVYTERGERNRIISARRATKKEEKDYYEQYRY